MSRVLWSRVAGSRRTLSLVPWASRGMFPPVGARGKNGVSEEEDELERPIHFSSSKASPHRWTVENSLGSDRRRPWWKVVPLSVSLIVLIVWCFLRKETDTDKWLTEESSETEVNSEQLGSQAALSTRT